MRTALLALLLASGCVSSEAPPSSAPPATPPPASAEGGDRTVSGTVTEKDFDPMAYDGDGVLTIETDGGDVVRVFIPARMHLCDATFPDFETILAGVAIEVRGEAVDTDGVRPCTSAEHYVRRR
jgi:hypothetical protein